MAFFLTETFFFSENFLKKNKQTNTKFDLFKNCEINNFLAILEICAFYIKYKKVKFMATNFFHLTNIKYFMETQLLRFCKVTTKVSSLLLWKTTTKSTYFLPAKKKISELWIELQTNEIQRVSRPYIYTTGG